MTLTSEKLSRKAGGALSALALANLAMQTLLAGSAVAAPTPQGLRGSSLDFERPAEGAQLAQAHGLSGGVQATTRMLGEDYGPIIHPQPQIAPGGIGSTRAMGEEDGRGGAPTPPPAPRPAPAELEGSWYDQYRLSATTMALGEESGLSIPGPAPSIGNATTMAMGEESGSWGGASTYAVGEEDGPTITTAMVGEESGTSQPVPPPGVATTEALGEESGSWGPAPTTLALGEEGAAPTPPPSSGNATTMALGEESGSWGATTYAMGEEGGVAPQPAPPAQITTMALGEETSSWGPSTTPRPLPGRFDELQIPGPVQNRLTGLLGE